MKPLSILKIILSLIIFGTLSLNSHAFNFATTLYENNEPLKSTNIKLRISIINSEPNGEACYIEEFNTSTNKFGVANVVVGKGNVISGDFNEVKWEEDKYIKMEYLRSTDSSYLLGCISKITAVPYSIYSQNSNSLTLTSPNGNEWGVNVNDSGELSAYPKSSVINNIEYGTVDYIFDINALPTITLEISTDEWNKLLANFDKNPNNEECIVSDFYFNKYGVIHKVENIGLRLRGNTSRVRPEGDKNDMHSSTNPNWHHCHFGFRFEKFQDNNLFSGTDRFNLRWFKEDATYCHEIYSYDLLRRFGVWSTFKSSYCRLKIKIKEDNSTAYWGIYEMFEGADDQYLNDRLAEGKINGNSGFLWKMSWGSGVGAFLTLDQADEKYMGIEDIPLEGSSISYTYDYKSKKKKLPEAKAQLIQFIKDLNTKSGEDFIKWAEEKINIELLLRAYAVTTAVGQWDDYWCNGNNFYLYFDTDGRCHYIPYDFDNSLGTSNEGIMYNPGTKDPLNWGNANRPLITKVLAVEKWRNLYISYLKELADPHNDYLDADKSIQRIKNWYSLIEEYVDNDTKEDCSIIDKPASWSSGVKNYRLLIGDEFGGIQGTPNFFRTRVKTIEAME